MKQFRRLVAGVSISLGVASAGCRRDKPAQPPADSTHPAPSTGAESTTAAHPVSTWDAGAGSVLLVSSDVPTHAIVVLPSETDSTTLATLPHPASAILLGRGGDIQ